jgi:hypothetical protein
LYYIIDMKIIIKILTNFNEGVIKNGGKIYINPKFINH